MSENLFDVLVNMVYDYPFKAAPEALKLMVWQKGGALMAITKTNGGAIYAGAQCSILLTATHPQSMDGK